MPGAEAIGDVVALIVRTTIGEQGTLHEASFRLLKQGVARLDSDGDAAEVDASLLVDGILLLVLSEARDSPGTAEFTRRLGAERSQRVAEQLRSASRIVSRAPAAGIAVTLTPREQEVLAELQWHRPLAVVAADLNISLNTVKTHVRAIYRKLQVDGRSRAVDKAHQLNLL